MRNRVEQDRCCEAVLRMFEVRLDRRRTDVFFPENQNRSTKDVEVCASVGERKFAIEHTLIEPMEGFLESGRHFDDLTSGFDDLIAGKVPADQAFQLLIPLMALKGIKNRQVSRIRKALAAFTVDKMRLLANPSRKKPDIPSDIAESMVTAGIDGNSEALADACAKLVEFRSRNSPPNSITVMPEGVPFHVTLATIRIPRPGRLGTLQVVRSVEADMTCERVRRIIRALKDKSGKLKRRKRQSYSTVLVLESNDINLTSNDAVFGALSNALNRVDMPADHIFFADTCTTTYAFWHFIVGGQINNEWYADWSEFDALNLDSAGSENSNDGG